MNDEMRSSGTSMIFASLLALVLGFVMLLYPGGTMVLMDTAFRMMQWIVSVFILAYAVSEGVRYFKGSQKGFGVFAILVGIVATLLVWVFDVRIIAVIFAIFCIVAGMGDIIGSFSFTVVRAFLLLLGIANIMVGAIILKYPVALPLLIAWYIVFWGLSRLLLALELRRLARQA